MTTKKAAPVPDKVPERTPFERMADLTRRIVQVPKSEVVREKKRKRKHG